MPGTALTRTILIPALVVVSHFISSSACHPELLLRHAVCPPLQLFLVLHTHTALTPKLAVQLCAKLIGVHEADGEGFSTLGLRVMSAGLWPSICRSGKIRLPSMYPYFILSALCALQMQKFSLSLARGLSHSFMIQLSELFLSKRVSV